MEIEIRNRPSYALGSLTLAGGEQVRVEGGSMVGMSEGVSIETSAEGGFLKSLGRAIFGGESFFLNSYTAPPQGGVVMVAPALPGDLVMLEIAQPMLIQSGCYVASEMSLNINTKWTGAKTFFGGQGFIMLRTEGQGKVLVSAFGAIEEYQLEGGQSLTLDSGHIVAFEESVGYNVRAVGGIKSTVFSGEGLVVDLRGPGKVLMQTRSPNHFISWMDLNLPRRESSSS